MKRYFMGLACLAVMALCQFAITTTASAQNVWVMQQPVGDSYVVTETIDSDGSSYVNVTTKTVKNFKLIKVEERMYGYVADHQTWYMNTKEGRRNNLRATRILEGENDPVLGFCLNYVRS